MIVKEGFLFCKLESTNQWKKLWFALNNQSKVEYYEKQESGEKSDLCEISLKGDTVVHSSSSYPTYRKCLFEIEVPTSNTRLLLSAASEEEKSDWINSLNRFLQKEVTTETKVEETTNNTNNDKNSKLQNRLSGGWSPKRTLFSNHRSTINLGRMRNDDPVNTTSNTSPTIVNNSTNNNEKNNEINSDNNVEKTFDNITSSNSSINNSSISSNSSNDSNKSSGIQLGNLVLPIAPEKPDESQLVIDEKFEVKQATIEKLVECLYNSYSYAQYIIDFLLSYRAFVQPIHVLNLLIDGYSKLKDSKDTFTNQYRKACRLRICNFMKKWVELNYQDIENDEEFIKKYLEFVEENIMQQDTKLGGVLKHKLVAKTSQPIANRDSLINIFNSLPPQSIVTKSNVINLLTVHPTEMARQLTLLEYQIYRSIQPHEFFNNAWASSDKETKSRNIIKMSTEFNNIGKWVASEIVREKNLKLRSKKLKRFINIATECVRLNNFHGAFEITAGISNSAVHRLKKTHESLTPDIKQKYEDLLLLTNPTKSWQNFRNSIHSVDPPCVPFIGIFQTDLTFISDGNQLKVNGLINFRKCKLLAGVIKEIQLYQHKPYNLTTVTAIQNFITEAQNQSKSVTDQELFDLSVAAEPKTVPKPE